MAIFGFVCTGSAWIEYKKSGTMHGIKLPEGLVESQKLPEPVFTPSTKAEQGAHDENLHPGVGTSLLSQVLLCRQSTATPTPPKDLTYLPPPTSYLPPCTSHTSYLSHLVPLPRVGLVEQLG